MPSITSNSKRARPQANLAGHLRHGLRESALLLVTVMAVFLLMALISYHPADPAWSRTGGSDTVHNLGGITGAWVADVSLYFLGYTAFLLAPLMAAGGWLWLRLPEGNATGLSRRALALRVLGMSLIMLACCALAGLFLQPNANWLSGPSGGVLGELMVSWLVASFNRAGSALVLSTALLVGVNLLTGSSWLLVVEITGRITLALLAACAAAMVVIVRLPMRLLGRLRQRRARRPAKGVANEAPVRPASAETLPRIERLPPAGATSASPGDVRSGASSLPALKPAARPSIAPAKALAAFAAGGRPALDLLDPPRPAEGAYSTEMLATLSRQVEEKLRDFGIEVEVVSVQPGPVITRFELQPAPGVKVSQITNLAKDLARGLSVIAVRVVEVIPGKSFVGLEIPNASREVVALREILESRVYQDSESPLTLTLGKDIGGHPVVANLSRMPHLLVAGTTGAGKSVAINAMLLSMLYKSSPRDLRLILVDPKMLELSIYEGIPHLLSPVVTDMKDAATALRWCVAEMERRYRLMAALKVRNIAGYNKRVTDAIKAGEPITDPLARGDLLDEGLPPVTLETLPFLVVVIDELADLMMVVGKKVEELIARLAQKARAAGIHLILATQRPSVDVITGLIKANIPTRIAFQVSSKVDSRTILDQMGAETLLGHGDMLFLPPGTGFPQRLHGAFVDDHEVIRVVEHLKASGEPDYIDMIEDFPDEAAGGFEGELGEDGDGESDALYDQAVRIVTESGRASASGIQRRLKIGYNRAARLIESMEMAGIVSPQGSNGMREVLAPAPPGD